LNISTIPEAVMGYVDDNLLADEKVVYRAHLHWIIYAWPAFFAAVAIVLIIVGLTREGFLAAAWIGFVTLVAAALAALAKYIGASTAEFAVTNRRVLIKVGAISRHTLELLLHKVEGVGVDQDLGGRIFDFGTIVVTGTGGTKERFPSIANPLEFRRQVQDQSGRSAASPINPEREPQQDGAGPFCVSCGTRNPPGANYCSKCGTKFTVG
jgi:uncharacterized membrane protein YdbT with pleckstrin-like domain